MVLYGNGILKLPVTSLTKKFKYAEERLKTVLSESRDVAAQLGLVGGTAHMG